MSSKPPTESNNDQFVNVSGIHGFGDLFEQDPKAAKARQLRFGSRLLISGPPGSGKTTFALSMVRAMISKAPLVSKTQKGTDVDKCIVYYISSEVTEEQLRESFDAYGWFAAKDSKVNRGSQFQMGSDLPDETNFYAITPMPDVDRPVPSAEELVNGIFSRIARTLQPSESPSERAKVYVIVDSISALLKGCLTPGDERRQTHEIMRRLQDKFDESHLALIILLAEQDHRSQDPGNTSAPVTPTEPSVEDYLADVVFRLYVRSMPLGRRIRVLEVVKSQGANMILGEHTWQIASASNCYFLRYDLFKEEIRTMANGVSDSEWGSIVIFPRPRLRPDDESPSTEPESTGNGVLSEVSRGSVTLIAGPMGCYKTSLCKAFLNHSKEGADPDRKKRFLISFDNSSLKPGEHDHFTPLSFTQSQFDLNILASHIYFLLKNGCERIAFDGLSEWITMFDRPEAARMLEALMITVRQKIKDKNPPTVFMTYELPLGDDPLGPSALGTTADNILVVRPVAINDVSRKIAYTLKQGNKRPEEVQHPVELEWISNEKGRLLKANRHSLDAYTGLLSKDGKISPARVLVQFFAENDFEREFNKQRSNELRQQFRKRIDLTSTTFDLSEIGTTLESALGPANPSETFNLSIHSIDEWWLASREIEKFLVPVSEEDREYTDNERLKATPADHESHARRFLHDFWWFEVEKSMAKVDLNNLGDYYTSKSRDASDEKRKEGGASCRTKEHVFAVPGYMDFGMLCFDSSCLTDAEDKQSPNRAARATNRTNGTTKQRPSQGDLSTEELNAIRRRWRGILADVPRTWVHLTRPNEWKKDEKSELVFDGWFTADAEGAPSDATNLIDYGLRLMEQRRRPKQASKTLPRIASNLQRQPVFTFDSSTRETCACMFLEWAWAFGGSEALLSQEPLDCNEKAIKLALYFAQFLIMEGLMPARCTAKSRNQDNTPILFSRQWYSTLRDMQASGNENILALPFMPVGYSDTDMIWRSLLDDIAVRQCYWLQRAKRYQKERKLNLDLIIPLELAVKDLMMQCSSMVAGEKVDAKKVMRLALIAYRESRSWLLKMAAHPRSAEDLHKSDNWTSTLDDLMELAAWAALRLQLLMGTRDGKVPHPPKNKISSKKPRPPALEGLYLARWVRHNVPELDTDENMDLNPVPTGWVCTGSWMYGVGRKSRSSAIQQQILKELTSLETAQQRAEKGAGLPARRDFYDLNGSDPVEGMTYLRWRELLRYGGSRARRRDRVLAQRPEIKEAGFEDAHRPPDPMSLYEVIYREMLACMRIADLLREQYARTGDKAARASAIRDAKARANLAFNSIREKAKKIHEEPKRKPS